MISASNPLPLSASAVSRVSLNSRFTTRLMFGANRTAVWWAAASISAFWSARVAGGGDDERELAGRRTPAGSAIVPAGAEKSMTQSGRVDERQVVGDRHADRPDAGDLARVVALQRVGSAQSIAATTCEVRVVLGQRDEPLAHPPARPVDRDVRLHGVPLVTSRCGPGTAGRAGRRSSRTAFSAIAWATSSRSNGSLWIGGSRPGLAARGRVRPAEFADGF